MLWACDIHDLGVSLAIYTETSLCWALIIYNFTPMITSNFTLMVTGQVVDLLARYNTVAMQLLHNYTQLYFLKLYFCEICENIVP